MKFEGLIKLASLSLILSSALGLSAAMVTKNIDLDLATSKDLIVIQNLAGKIKVTPSRDNKLHIAGLVTAENENDKKANEILDSIKLTSDKKSGQTIISVVYPVDDYSGFIYNPDSKTGFWNNSSSNSKYMGKRVKVANKAKGIFSNWANVHVDLDIKLPADQLAKIKVVSGEINARDLNNKITLDTSSGQINVIDSQGKLLADSGSGRVSVENFNGQVTADTGSGGIVLTNIKGNVNADTGSGGIRIENVTGRVRADTGSGSVKVYNYMGGDLLNIETGSGSVRVEGDLGNLENLRIDTGSGSVSLVTTHAPSMHIEVDTGSGGINIDLPNMDVKRDKRGDFEATIGKGKGKARIDTGSGGVSFKMDKEFHSNTQETAKPKKASASSKAQINKSDAKENPELAARILAELNKDKDIRNANLEVKVIGTRAYVSGSMDSLWDIAKVVKTVNSVEGVERVTVDLDLDDDE